MFNDWLRQRVGELRGRPVPVSECFIQAALMQAKCRLFVEHGIAWAEFIFPDGETVTIGIADQL